MFVFSRSGGSWTQTDNLVVADGDSQDRFGWELTALGTTSSALIAAPWDESPSRYDEAGTVYVRQPE